MNLTDTPVLDGLIRLKEITEELGTVSMPNVSLDPAMFDELIMELYEEIPNYSLNYRVPSYTITEVKLGTLTVQRVG